MYINIIRDPIDRLVSWYYFRRFQEGHIRKLPEEERNRVRLSVYSCIYNVNITTITIIIKILIIDFCPFVE